MGLSPPITFVGLKTDIVRTGVAAWRKDSELAVALKRHEPVNAFNLVRYEAFPP